MRSFDQIPTMTTQQPPSTAALDSLALAVEQNETIQEAVEQSATELVVINAVLKQEVPEEVQTGDVAQALRKTDELESRIQTSAEELARVNDVLKQEIGERAELERQLAQTEAELARARGLSPGHSRHAA